MSRSMARLAVTIILGSIISRIMVSSDRLGWVLVGEAFKHIRSAFALKCSSRLSFNDTGINLAITGTLTDAILQSAGDLQNQVFSNSSLAVDYVQTSYVGK
jgi:hypothetical protein